MKRYLYLSLFCLVVALALIVVMFTMNARADPFLVCDPQTDVTHYVVTINAITEIVKAVDLGDGTVILRYDLESVPEGQNDCLIKAKNEWGESVAVPFVFTRAGPVVPANVRIQKND